MSRLLPQGTRHERDLARRMRRRCNTFCRGCNCPTRHVSGPRRRWKAGKANKLFRRIGLMQRPGTVADYDILWRTLRLPIHQPTGTGADRRRDERDQAGGVGRRDDPGDVLPCFLGGAGSGCVCGARDRDEGSLDRGDRRRADQARSRQGAGGVSRSLRTTARVARNCGRT